MIRRALFIGCVFVLPSIAAAQRGGATSRATKKDEMVDRSDEKGPTIRVRDVEDENSIHLLLDKKKDLKLTDAQVAQLKDSEGKLKDKNAPSLKVVDSLIHDMMRTASNNSDIEASHQRNVRAALINAIAEVQANYDASAKDAMATFDADQQAKANELLAKQRADGDKTIREKMNSGGKP